VATGWGLPAGLQRRIDQTTLRPSVDVEYALLKDVKRSANKRNWHGMSDSGQRLTLARLLDSRQLGPVNMKLAIRIAIAFQANRWLRPQSSQWLQ